MIDSLIPEGNRIHEVNRNDGLTQEELQFVLGLLENVQISGSAEQVRAVLKLRDGAMGKLGRSAGKGGEEERKMR